MNSLQEELRQLTINESCDDGYLRTGKVAALVDNLQKSVAAEQEKNENYSLSKTAPWIPPKPSRKPNEIPQVPLSKLVTDTREPLYSQPLQATTAVGSESACIFLRKHAAHLGHVENVTSQSTLDNPAVLEHQLEALAYHKLQMEKKGLLSRPTNALQSIPNLSSTSLGTRKISGVYSDKPMKAQLSMRSDNCNALYTNVQQSSPQIATKQAVIYNSQSLAEREFEDDLAQPPSPVSSSYSELRRASNVFTKDSDVRTTQPVTSASIFHRNYVNHYAPNIKDFKSKGSVDYYGYGGLSQSSSTYDSIYEPINPRPANDVSSRANFNNMYPSYVNQSGSENYPVFPSSSVPAENVDLSKRLPLDGNISHYNLSSIDAGEVESYGKCNKCGERVLGENSGCTAMDQIYHISCFTCTECQKNLQGKPFYSLEGNPFCEYDYLQTLEKCSVCLMPILERILRATGKPYHPQCFTCVVCGTSLDAIPFTVDATNQNYCIEDFHKKFAPRCCVCKDPIMPEPGQEETVRVVALDRSFHLECYKCEDCGLLLSSEADGRGCYPLDDHVLCKSCNAKRVQVLTDCMT